MSNLVSIIIPTFNRADLIGETIDSILVQTHINWECIVVDDGSTDDMEIVVNQYAARDSRIQFHKRPENAPKGANACRNYGFQISKGDYINWYDSDDLLHPQKFEKQLAALAHSDYPFSVCQTMIFEGSVDNVLMLRDKKIISDQPFVDYIGLKIGFLTQAPMWRRSFLIQNNYQFDEELQAAQEWEFHSRILFHHKKYHTIEEPLVFLRRHENNITNNKASFNARQWNYLQARIKIRDKFKSELSPVELLFFSHYFIYVYYHFKKIGMDYEAKWVFKHNIATDLKTLLMFFKTATIRRILPIIHVLKGKK